MGYLAKTGDISFENMRTAVVYGSTMASFCVEEFSLDKLKTLDGPQILQRYNQFVELMRF